MPQQCVQTANPALDTIVDLNRVHFGTRILIRTLEAGSAKRRLWSQGLDCSSQTGRGLKRIRTIAVACCDCGVGSAAPADRVLNRVHFENRGYVSPQSGNAPVRGASSELLHYGSQSGRGLV
jgi:hypothetical protein